jgi:BolA protein
MTLQEIIQRKLSERLAPEHLDVINESSMHDVPPGSESHFRLLVVSSRFEGMPLVQRHREVYRILAREKEDSIHALAMETLTPREWEARGRHTLSSPPCRGGSKSGPA